MDKDFDIEPDDIEESEPSECQKEFAIHSRDFLDENMKPKPLELIICCYNCVHFDYHPKKLCKVTGAEVVDEMAAVNCEDFERYVE